MFRTTFTHTYKTELPPNTPHPLALSLLHDFPLMITLNPLVESYTLLPESPEANIASFLNQPAPDSAAREWDKSYEVVDLVSYLPFHLWDARVPFTVKFRATASGMESLVNAPAGVVILGRWKLVQPTGRDLVLEEEAEVSCSRMLAGFVKRSMKESHKVLAQTFAERLEVREAPKRDRQ